MVYNVPIKWNFVVENIGWGAWNILSQVVSFNNFSYEMEELNNEKFRNAEVAKLRALKEIVG